MWQLCSGIDENAIGACAQFVFAVIKLFEVMVSWYVPKSFGVAFGHSIWN